MMITVIGPFLLDCFGKKKEQFGGGEVPVVGGEGKPWPRFDTAPGVKTQHPTFLEQIFGRGKQTLFYPNKPLSSVKSIKLISIRQDAQKKKNSQLTNPKALPEAAL